MSTRAVEVADLAKRYQVGLNSHTTLREMLAGMVGRKQPETDGARELWALDGVDFALDAGEVVGIIGRNGAGKSTLLKVLARITEPTRGEARVRGRLASLLEVGTGFHEELTGRENVYLNGVVLGMGRREIDRRFDDIVDFSGITGRFLDMQIKRYSSGMKLRLAFAVASHLDTEVVVVDEVLAVGDAEFQRRCLQKMGELRESGRTILFVSHDIGTVAQLCPRCIWLAQGKVLQDGPSQQVIDAYQASFGAAGIRSTIAGETFGRVRIDRAELVAPDGSRVERLRRADPFSIEVEYTVLEAIDFFDAAFYIEDSRGVRVFDEALHESVSGTAALGAPGRHRLALGVDLPLAAKEYALSLWIGGGGQTFIEEPIMRFEVSAALEDRDRETRKPRVLHGTGTWRTEHLGD